MGIRGELFSTTVQLDKRTYFFNIKENRMGDIFLNIVESKKNEDSEGFERRAIVLFRDDMRQFLKGMDECIIWMEKEGAKRGFEAHSKRKSKEGDAKPRDSRPRAGITRPAGTSGRDATSGREEKDGIRKRAVVRTHEDTRLRDDSRTRETGSRREDSRPRESRPYDKSPRPRTGVSRPVGSSSRPGGTSSPGATGSRGGTSRRDETSYKKTARPPVSKAPKHAGKVPSSLMKKKTVRIRKKPSDSAPAGSED